ncbi:unnamed protein product, partial [Hapterophycus canaliculatus]
EIREYSEASFQENDSTAENDREYHAAETKERTTNSTSESLEESYDHREARTATDEEHERDAAQQKLNRRARAQPGAKRGGRRDTERGGWRRWGKKKNQFEAGDLVEAEWKGSGWWYVGYIGVSSVNGEESKDGTTSARGEAMVGKHRKGVFHVVFADGDEAEVLGKKLKPLRAKGTSRDADATALPGYIPVVDVGCGRLHCCELDPPSSKKNQPKESKILRRGSAGNIENRRRQGEQALWGGRGTSSSGPPTTEGRSGVGLLPEEDGDWWATGTRYAFQPRLPADTSTVKSFMNRRGRNGGAIGTGSITNSAASGLSLQRQGRVRSHQNVASQDDGRGLLRIVKAPVGNENHGQRVFFLA